MPRQLERQDQQPMRIEIVAADGNRTAARNLEGLDRPREFPQIAEEFIVADLAVALDQSISPAWPLLEPDE